MKKPKNFFKYVIGLIAVIFLRLIPHPPNVEPVMSSMMPFAKRWGWLAGSLFSALAILSFDVMTGTLGVWSIVTASTYALLGAAAGFYFTKKRSRIMHYVGFAVVGTLIYDFITGPIMSSMIWKMPFSVAFFGQIPFTINHLLGNIVLAMVVSPLLHKWIIENPKLETEPITNRFRAVFGYMAD